MSEATLVWKVIKHHAPGYWRRIEDRANKGTPDCVFAIKTMGCGMAELKYLREWPKGVTNLGLSKLQVLFLNRFANNGGRCWLIARIDNHWLFVRGQDVPFETTMDGWLQRACYYTNKVDWDNLEEHL